MAKVKQFIPWVVLAFLVYAVVTSPNKSADLVRNIWEILSDGVSNIAQFFDNILNG
ncbi:hypothetical protein PZ938_08395 [Luteipulveratus sp. YIM 133132]|uniref:Uncharacterized protein n=1 Tax=Luteipulveratus flavus TaxID=3031728 RepID=A0ABT6CCV0_9MICO|nr:MULTISPECIES: hypothetical protein [unclassified Luteipulveratus]MDE9365624.1 hypothetical protein [Luteipulveratus sp. YIM 133132]MDF8266338.1 hypothetical protein [Luteipulveratus sp. YIM 133296]